MPQLTRQARPSCCAISAPKSPYCRTPAGRLIWPPCCAILAGAASMEVWGERGARWKEARCAARSMAQLGELASLEQRVNLKWQDMRQVGNDLRILAKVEKG